MMSVQRMIWMYKYSVQLPCIVMVHCGKNRLFHFFKFSAGLLMIPIGRLLDIIREWDSHIIYATPYSLISSCIGCVCIIMSSVLSMIALCMIMYDIKKEKRNTDERDNLTLNSTWDIRFGTEWIDFRQFWYSIFACSRAFSAIVPYSHFKKCNALDGWETDCLITKCVVCQLHTVRWKENVKTES